MENNNEKGLLNRRRTILLWIVWFIFFALLRWNSFTALLDRDEAVYAYVAREMMEGKLPYKSVFDHKPPLIYLVYHLAQSIDKDALWLPRVISFVTTSFTIMVVAYIARREFGKKSAMPTAFILALMFSHPALSPTFANTEIFMLLPMMIAYLCYLTYKSNKNTINFFLFGVSAAISLFFKPLALFVFLFIAIVWIVKVLKNEGFKNAVRASLYILSGVIVVSCLILIPFVKNSLETNLYEMVVVYNRQFALGPWFKRRIARFTYVLFTNWPLLFLLPLWFIYKRPKRWWFYSGLVAASLLAIFKTDLGHYYLLLIPFWAMIVIYSINSLAGYLVKRYNFNFDKTKLLIVTVTTVSLLIPIAGQLFIKPEKFTTYVHKQHNPFEEAVVVAEKLSSISETSDTLYIAGHEPEVLIYANRKSASRFIYAYPLIFGHPLKEKYQIQMMNDLKHNKPDFIVLSSEFLVVNEDDKVRQPMKYWNGLISKDYKLVGGAIRERDKVFWKEGEGDINLNEFRLLLYSII